MNQYFGALKKENVSALGISFSIFLYQPMNGKEAIEVHISR
jgi:hypothetical protein